MNPVYHDSAIRKLIRLLLFSEAIIFFSIRFIITRLIKWDLYFRHKLETFNLIGANDLKSSHGFSPRSESSDNKRVEVIPRSARNEKKSRRAESRTWNQRGIGGIRRSSRPRISSIPLLLA